MKTILIAVATPALRLLCESALRDQGFCVLPLDRPLAPLSLVSSLEWDAALLDGGQLGRGALEAISVVSGENLVGLGFEVSRLSATLALPVSNVDIACVFERLFFEPDRGGPELRLDPARRMAFANGRQVLLTRTEFRLLQLLNDARPADVPFADVLKSVWGYSAAEATTELVRSHLRNLRLKLREIGLEDVLHSRRGRGYALDL